MSGTVINFRIERLAHRAPAIPLAISDDDRAYVTRHLEAVAEAFGVKAVPDLSLALLPANCFVHHLGELLAQCRYQDLEQRLAYGRLESVLRLVESVVTVMNERGSLRSA